ncbi:hypothetical protein Tco_1394411 [Tanacetum coccineum]
MIRKYNQRLSSTLKSNEPTIPVALDALKLTPFYNAFEVSADVPEIYMQEDMLKICPKLPGQKFEEPPFEEEILPLIRDLGHTSDIKVLFDVNIYHMHQPWRSLAAIINKCLSGKTTGLERLRLSSAQLLWGMYYNKHIDSVYLLWEDFMFQVENKDSNKNNDMFYPCFTKVLVDYFMAKDLSKSRRNKMFWHTARDDSMFTTIREKQPATKSKAKGLTVLSEVALSEDEQMKLAIRIMDTTKARQKALDDALVAPKNRLMIRKYNQRLSLTIKSNEPTIQVALDALKLTPFYNAFEVSANVPKIYIDMLKICPKLPGQKFEEPPFEEEILPLIRDLGHTSDIKVLSIVNINHMHQPWRSLPAIINKCLSGKTTGLERLRLSHAQLLWGMYYNKHIDYVYLLWEDFMFQVENKDSKKNNDMFYPCFTKVIVDYFMAKDPSISRRNKMFWHTAKDDSMFTTIRVISKHQDTQIYSVSLPQHLTNQAMLESEAYKTYHAYATGEKTPKPKKKKADSESSPKEKIAQASKGKRLKTSSTTAQYTKKKQPTTKSKAKGLTVLSEVALTQDKQMKLATKRSQIQTHSSHASGSDEGAGDKPEVPDVLDYNSDSEEESWTFSDGDDDDDVNEESDTHDDSNENESDDEGDDFVHPNLSTYTPDDQDEEENVEDKEKAEGDEDMSDQRVHTPPDYQLSKKSENQKDDDVEDGEEYDDEEILYRDLNLNWERNDADMSEAQATKNTEDAHVTLNAVTPVVQQQSSSVSYLVSKFINSSKDESIDSVLNQNIQSDTLVDIPVTTATETPSSDTTTLQPSTLHIHSLQTPVTTTSTTFPTTTLPEIPNFASLFGFEQRVSSLEIELSELKQTNKFVKVVSSISGIVDNYLASKMKEAVDVAVQLKSNKLREEAQAENQDFINSLDSNMNKIIKQQVKAQTSKIMSKLEKYVTDTLRAEVLVRSTNQSQTSYAAASLLSELELKKILMDKMEENKSIDRSEVQKNLYNALVEAYNTDKDIISTYGNVVIISRGHSDEDKDEEPSAGSNRRTKRRRSDKETESTNEPTHKESRITSSSRDEDVTPSREAQDEHQWHPSSSPIPDLEWHLTKNVSDLPLQPWITHLA